MGFDKTDKGRPICLNGWMGLYIVLVEHNVGEDHIGQDIGFFSKGTWLLDGCIRKTHMMKNVNHMPHRILFFLSQQDGYGDGSVG